MSDSVSKMPISSRWPLAFWFGAAFCFFIFPVFLVDVGLENMLNTRYELQRQSAYRYLGQRLERLQQYGNSRHYFSALLQKTFEFAQRQADPLAYLRIALPHLNARNFNAFKFIIWDKKGGTINELTDEKGYRYIVRTIYDVIRDVAADVRKNYPGEPENLKSLDRNRLNLLRSYLGPFLIPEKLNLPFLRGSFGECVLVSGKPEKTYVWYQIGEKFSMLATIGRDAVESEQYLLKLVDGMNKSDADVKYGIVDLLRDNDIHATVAPGQKAELMLGLARFDNFSQQRLETDNFLLVVRLINPFLRSFAFIEKKNILFDRDGFHKKILFLAAAMILLASVVLLTLLYRGNRVFSIRWKLGLLFLYANGLPLLILGFIGYEYLQQNRRLMLDQAYEKISGVIADFDTRFATLTDEIAGQLNRVVDQINARHGSGDVPVAALKELYEVAEKNNPYNFNIADVDGKTIMSDSVQGGKNRFFSALSQSTINYANFSSYTDQRMFKDNSAVSGGAGRVKIDNVIATDTILFHTVFQRLRKIHPEQMGAEAKQYYWNLLGDFDKRIFKNFIAIAWEFATLQEMYVRRNIDILNENSPDIRFKALVETNGMSYPAGSELSQNMLGLFRQTFNLRTLRVDEVEVDKIPCAAFGTVGKRLDRVGIIGFVPLDRINDRINRIRVRLIVFGFLSLGLTAGVGWLLAAQFMTPVRELEKGVHAIGRQNFRYRLPIDSADEFGRLSQVFNSAIESLEDLEVARIVQENLFPQEALNLNKLQVFGCSVAMTRLGGDYYDFFALDDRRVGVLMGDVAGHGVPAALLMAMAKASVLLSDEEKLAPAQLLAALHKVIHRVKSSKIKRMMTCQYFCIDSASGEYLVSNAGHCFPALIKKNGTKVELLELIGTPLGITKRPRYEDVAGRLEPGDIMLLYTDGIIESHNTAGQEMGFERFAEMLQRVYQPDLESFYHAIFAGYKEWAASADDDITMVLIKFAAEVQADENV